MNPLSSLVFFFFTHISPNILVLALTCRSAVPGEGVPRESLCTALTVRARSVVDAAQTVARVRVTDPRG